MHIRDITVRDAIIFTGDLKPGRFRSIGVVTGIFMHKGVGGEIYLQRLSTMSYYVLKVDADGTVVESDVPWDVERSQFSLGPPVKASDAYVQDVIDSASRQKGHEPFEREYVHPATIQLLERIGRLDYITEQ